LKGRARNNTAGTDVYVDLRGRPISLGGLERSERALVDELLKRFESGPGWNEFENYWTARVASFYDERGVSREDSCRTPVYLIAQDLGSRIGIDGGYVRMPDYRDELADLIRRRFESRRAFCKATGLSEDMLSHVLARRKHLSIEALTNALAKVGCSLHIMPAQPVAATKG
jgi:hypothetical protein